MKKCENCTYWGTGEDYYSRVLKVRRCNYAVDVEDATEWNDDYDRVLKDKFKETKAFVADASGYSAHLYTAADFCCSQYDAH